MRRDSGCPRPTPQLDLLERGRDEEEMKGLERHNEEEIEGQGEEMEIGEWKFGPNTYTSEPGWRPVHVTGSY